MDENDENLLANFELRMRRLMHLCETLREENQHLRTQLSQKDSIVTQLTSNLDLFKTKYDNLKFAKSFVEKDSEEYGSAKQRLSKLVQDVEKCIILLKK